MWTYPIGKWGGTEAKVDEIISAFNAEYPDITLKVEFLDYANGDTQVTSAITAGNTPDIIMEGPERLVSNWGAPVRWWTWPICGPRSPRPISLR